MKRLFGLLLTLLMIGGLCSVAAHATGSADERFPDLNATEYRSLASGGEGGTIGSYEDAKAAIVAGLQNVYKNTGETFSLTFAGTDDDYKLKFGDDCVECDPFVEKAYYNAIYDNPEALFFVRTSCSWTTSYNSGKVIVTVTPTYFTREQMPQAAFTAALERALDECYGSHDTATITANGMTELERAVAAHDWIVSNCFRDPYVNASNNKVSNSTQDPFGAGKLSGGKYVYDEDPQVYTPYGVLVNHKAVCQGYALAYKALLDRAGVGCAYAHSPVTKHAWNMVRLGGNWLHTDVTQADKIHENKVADWAGGITRDCFLRTDAQIREEDELHSGWTTEDDLTCGTEYALPDTLKASTASVYYYDGMLYLSRLTDGKNAEVRAYAPGSDFASPDLAGASTDTVGTSFAQLAAALDPVNGVLYLRNWNDTKIFCADLTKIPLTVTQLDKVASQNSYGVCVTARQGGQHLYTTKSFVIVDDKQLTREDITPIVSITNWEYGKYSKSTNGPAISGNSGNGAVTYYYNTVDSASGGTELTADAAKALGVGEYYLYATVGETTSYNAATTLTAPFSVTPAPRKDAAAAMSVEWSKRATLDLADKADGALGAPVAYAANADTEFTALHASLSGTVLTVTADDDKDLTGTKARVCVPVGGIPNYSGYTIVVTVTVTAKTVSPTITLAYDSATYDETAKTPAVTVKDSDTPIDESEYTVEYKDNTNAGTGKAVVADKAGGKYVFDPEETTLTFAISRATIDPVPSVNVKGWTYGAYDKASHGPSITEVIGGGAVTYYCNTANSTSGGTALTDDRAKALGVGEYYLYAEIAQSTNYNAATTATKRFAVSRAPQDDIAAAMSVGWGQSGEFNLAEYNIRSGNLGEPMVYAANADTVVTTLHGAKLTVTAKDDSDLAGTSARVRVPVTGMANYSDHAIIVTVNITAKSVTPAVTLEYNSVPYDGKTKTPAVTVKDGDTVIDKSEYTVQYGANNTNAGNVSVTVTDKEGGKYAFTPVSSSFEITKTPISPVAVIRGWDYNAFDGTVNSPSVTGNTEGGAVTYYYSTTNSASGGQTWNITAASRLEAGDYYLYAEVAQTANCAGATTELVKFSVSKAEWRETTAALSVERGTTGAPVELRSRRAAGGAFGSPSVYGAGADTVTVELDAESNLTVATTNKTPVGTFTVRIGVTGAKNYRDYDIVVTVSVTAKAIEPTVTLEYESVTYDGEEKKPAVTVKDGDTPIDESEYTVGYEDNVSAGTAKVTVASKDSSGYSFQVAKHFVIARADAVCTTAPEAIPDLAYNGEEQTLVTAGTASGGTMQYRVGESGNWLSAPPGATDAGTYTVNYYVKGDSNHKDSASASVRVAVARTTRKDAALSGSVEPGKTVSLELDIEPGGTLGTPEIYGSNMDTQIVDTKRLRITASSSAPVDSELIVTIPVTGATNYEDYKIVATVKVVPVSYVVSVQGGTGGGSYAPGSSVSVTADAPPSNQVFNKWTTSSADVAFADATASTTTFEMPAHDVTVTATYKTAPDATFAVTVEHGKTNDSPAGEGATVTITADDAPGGQVFDRWTTGTEGVTFADASAAQTTFKMPARAVTVTATYKSESSTPAGTALTGTVTVSGTARVGQTLSATVTDTNNTGTLSYRWKSNGTDISGATGPTLYLGDSLRGTAITCEVTSSVQTGSITSAATASVAAAGSSSSSSSSSRATVSLNYTRLDLYVDDYGFLVATVTPSSYAGRVSWNSDNSKVVSVDSDGNFTANRKGTAYITASLSNGNEASCYVRVSEWTGSTSRSQDTGKKDETTTVIVPSTQQTSQTVGNSDGSRSTITNRADGTSTIIQTDKNGVLTSAAVTYSTAAVDSARYSGNSLLLPAEVRPAADINAAPELSIVLPASSQSVKVKIPLSPATMGAVAVVENLFGPDEIIKSSTIQNGDLTFKLNASAVVKVVDNSRSFYDVSSGEWYADSISWASSHDVMSGVSEHMFDPNGTMNRAMMTQIIYNYANASSTNVTSAFSDVDADDWYGKSVTWAADNGIASASDGSFGAENALTREDMASMLYNFCKMKGYSTYTNASINSFADNADVSDWARSAMEWAVGSGLIQGTQNGTKQVVLDPKGTATRAQLATIMRRFCEKVE